MTKSQKNLFTNTFSVILLAIICTVLWGSAFPGIKLSYQYFNITGNTLGRTLLLAGIRFTMAGLMTLITYFILIRKIIFPSKSNIPGIFLTGIVQTTLQYLFFYIALSSLTGAKGAILASTITFFSVIISHFMFQNDKINIRKMIGCTIGFAGIVIINLKGGGNLGKFSILGDGLMLLSTFFAAMGAMISKVVASKFHSVLTAGYQMILGGILLTIIGIAKGGSLKSSSIYGYLLLIYLALLSAIAFSLWTTLLKYNQPSKIVIFNFAIPVFGSLLSAIFLKESFFSIQNLIALICVCTGIYVVNKT